MSKGNHRGWIPNLLAGAAIAVALFSLGLTLFFQYFWVKREFTASIDNLKIEQALPNDTKFTADVVISNNGNQSFALIDIRFKLKRLPQIDKKDELLSNRVSKSINIKPNEIKILHIEAYFSKNDLQFMSDEFSIGEFKSRHVNLGVEMVFFGSDGEKEIFELLPYSLQVEDNVITAWSINEKESIKIFKK